MISVIIVTWNNEDIIEECLNALSSISQRMEVIVVDNNSSDQTVEIIENDFPGVRLIRNDANVGFARANNLAFKVSSGEFILLLNSDAFVVSGSIDALLEFMMENSSVGIAGPQLIFPNGSLQRSFGHFPGIARQILSLISLVSSAELVRKRVGMKFPDVACVVDYIEAACMLVRRKVIDEIGFFDEDYFFYGEDADFCFRAKKAGCEVYFVPHAKVVHLRGASSTKREGSKYLIPLTRAQQRFVQKHHELPYVWIWNVVTISSLLLRIGVNMFRYCLSAIVGSDKSMSQAGYKIGSLWKAVTMFKE